MSKFLHNLEAVRDFRRKVPRYFVHIRYVLQSVILSVYLIYLILPNKMERYWNFDTAKRSLILPVMLSCWILCFDNLSRSPTDNRTTLLFYTAVVVHWAYSCAAFALWTMYMCTV